MSNTSLSFAQAQVFLYPPRLFEPDFDPARMRVLFDDGYPSAWRPARQGLVFALGSAPLNQTRRGTP